MDIIVSTITLIVGIPFIVIIGIAIAIELGFPVMFKQPRPGIFAKPFMILKFRTMYNKKDVNGKLLPDEERISRIGRRLRQLSMDELPTLFNVVKGEMSLVGPRPLLMRYISRYTLFQMRRHEVKPGITGWAQINGRNAISWNEKFAYDVWYVDHVSFWIDIKILLMTVGKVFKREGISQDGHATMEEFLGSEKP